MPAPAQAMQSSFQGDSLLAAGSSHQLHLVVDVELLMQLKVHDKVQLMAAPSRACRVCYSCCKELQEYRDCNQACMQCTTRRMPFTPPCKAARLRVATTAQQHQLVTAAGSPRAAAHVPQGPSPPLTSTGAPMSAPALAASLKPFSQAG